MMEVRALAFRILGNFIDRVGRVDRAVLVRGCLRCFGSSALLECFALHDSLSFPLRRIRWQSLTLLCFALLRLNLLCWPRPSSAIAVLY